MLSTVPAVPAGEAVHKTTERNTADADADECEGGDGEGDEEEEDELASELWEGDSAVAAEDWIPPPPGDEEEECGEDDDDLDADAEGEEEEDDDDDGGASPLITRGTETRSSGSHRSAADTEHRGSPGGDCAGDSGTQAEAGQEGAGGRKNFKRVGSAGSGRRKKDKDSRWGGDVDEKGEMKTTTIDFSLSVDLRKTPELLCKSKDRVPLFKLTASGSYNCTRNAFRRAGFKPTKSNNFTVLWGMALKLPEFKELKEYQVFRVWFQGLGFRCALGHGTQAARVERAHGIPCDRIYVGAGFAPGHACAPTGERKRVSERALVRWRANGELHACTRSTWVDA